MPRSSARPARLFAEHGYAEVGTERIAHAAGVTRGALYHQFADKADLFAAVLEAVEVDLTARLIDAVAAAATDGAQPLDLLIAGADAWLDASAEPEVRRIALLDGPAVLGWERWREVGMRHGLGLVKLAAHRADGRRRHPGPADRSARPRAHRRPRRGRALRRAGRRPGASEGGNRRRAPPTRESGDGADLTVTATRGSRRATGTWVCEAEPMRYRRLGRTALQVSELCLGTMNFGPQTPEDESFAIMDRALELGINFFDTANRYGGDKGAGATESIIGRWFAQGGGRREKVVLATKLFGAMSEWPNDGRLSARHIRMACDDSLRRMQTDHIDLYQMHHVDRTAPWEEVWQAMDTLIQQGKITYVGSSNFAGWHIARANEAAARLHTLGLVSEQSHYNLLVRTVELEVLPACREYGVGVIPWSPLSSGLLGGVLGDSDRARRQSPQSLKRIDKLRPKLEQWEKLCADLGEEPAAVALAWLLAQDGVTCPIIGPRTMAQLDGASLRALEITLAPDTLTAIDAIFPGPGGTAPEAYAW